MASNLICHDLSSKDRQERIVRFAPSVLEGGNTELHEELNTAHHCVDASNTYTYLHMRLECVPRHRQQWHRQAGKPDSDLQAPIGIPRPVYDNNNRNKVNNNMIIHFQSGLGHHCSVLSWVCTLPQLHCGKVEQKPYKCHDLFWPVLMNILVGLHYAAVAFEQTQSTCRCVGHQHEFRVTTMVHRL
jgi:hypothetical protein